MYLCNRNKLKAMNRKFRWFILIAWLVLIFTLSQMAGEESSEQSRFIVWLFSVIGLDLNGWFGEMSMWIVRKAAHTFEYFMLCIFAHNVLHIYIRSKWRFSYALIASVLYACTDELHQLFISGRAGCIEDVLIDTFGAILGLISILLWYYIKKARTK